MTIYLAGSTSNLFTRRLGSVIGTDTNTSRRDTTFADAALDVGSVQNILHWCDFPSALSSLWLRVDLATPFTITSNLGGTIVSFASQVGGTYTELFKLIQGSTSLQWQYWNGTAWTNIGSAISLPANSRLTLSFNIVLNSTTGKADIYNGGTLVGSLSGNTIFTAATTINAMGIGSTNPSSNISFSQFLLQDESTIGTFVFTRKLLANGAAQAWANDVASANMNDRAVPDLTSMIFSDTADQVETYTLESLPSSSLYLRAIVVNTEARRSEAGPSRLASALRSGAAYYYGAQVSLGLGLTMVRQVFETDPATGLPWTTAGANALEAGVRSAA